MTTVPVPIITHAQRVCRLYKKAIRYLEADCLDRAHFRYLAVLMRDRFDQTKDLKDMAKAAALVEAGEEEAFLRKPLQPFFFKNDPDGILYQRNPDLDDCLLEGWNPWEKAPFIDYFKTRETRKVQSQAYFDANFPKKGSRDLENAEYPIPGPHVSYK